MYIRKKKMLPHNADKSLKALLEMPYNIKCLCERCTHMQKMQKDAHTQTHTHTHTVQDDRGDGQCCLAEIFWEEKCLESAFVEPYSLLLSRLTVLMSHGILNEWQYPFIVRFLISTKVACQQRYLVVAWPGAHAKLLPSWCKFCVHHKTMHQFTVPLHSKPHR